MFYVEEIKTDLAPDGSYTGYKTVGKVVELVYNKDTLEFKLEERRVIEDFNERYNKTTLNINTYNYYPSYQYFLTDKMELLYVEKSENIVMYEEIKLEKDLEKKFGRRDYNKEEFRTISDLTWVLKNGGFAAHSSEEVYFLRIDSKLRTVMPLIQINFQLNKGQMTISQVCPSLDPKLIVIALMKDADNLLLVWDIEINGEVSNFSTSNTWYFMYGPSSKSGYILNGDTFVNLDRGLINYFFEYTFYSPGMYEQKGGYRINKDEDMILENGN